MQNDPINTSEVLERLAAIEHHLRNLDRRDRMRAISSAIHTIFIVAMFVFVAGGSYYLLNNVGALIRMMAQETAKQTMQYGKEGSSDFLKELQGIFQK